MTGLLQSHPVLVLLAIAAAGFVVGRWTAPGPASTGQERRRREGERHRNSSKLKPADLDEIRQLLRQGQKISAIALVRKRLGIGLAEAKAVVEGIDS